ncbi:hypothetical protein ACHAWC_006968 [Mediolabrus comicus]
MMIKNTLIAFVLAGVLSGCSARSGHTRNVGYDNGYDIDSESPSTPEEYQADNSPASPTALTCNETEALLKVRYSFSEDEWNSFRPGSTWGFRRFLRVQGNSMHYDNFEDVMDYEGCLPKEECSEIIVAGLPTSAYDISFDGKSVDIGAEFRFDGFNPVTSTTVGACEEKEPPTCKDEEALVEVQYWSGYFSYPTQQFRVEDSNGGDILTGPGNNMTRYTLKETYACVPKDNACYTFLIGGEQVWDVNFAPPTSYSIAFDGQLVSTNDALPFDSVRFGGSCKPLCNQDNESLVELFMLTNNFQNQEFEHEWSLSVANHKDSSGAIPVGSDISPLVHKNICTPKGSCSSFLLSNPIVPFETVWNNETFNATFIPRPTYSLAMDNITYRKVQLSSWTDLNQTTNMGSCTVDGLCDEQSQDLFDLELHTPAKFESPWWGNEMPYVSSWPVPSIDWNFGYTFAEEWRLMRLLQSSDYINTNMAYELDSRYRTIECVPKGGYDMSFNLTSSFSNLFNTTSQTFPAVETHSVKKNGVPLLDSIFVDHVLMTPFGTNCFQSNNTLSGGAIAGIVVACVAALAAIVGLIWCKKRQNQQEKGEEDPLHESLL